MYLHTGTPYKGDVLPRLLNRRHIGALPKPTTWTGGPSMRGAHRTASIGNPVGDNANSAGNACKEQSRRRKSDFKSFIACWSFSKDSLSTLTLCAAATPSTAFSDSVS